MKAGDTKEIINDIRINRTRARKDEAIILSMEIQTVDKSGTNSWFFETEDSITEFDFHDAGYCDRYGKLFPENKPMIYLLNSQL